MTQEITGKECEMHVPASVSANGSEFRINCDCPLVKVNLKIFNRWGNIMFEVSEEFNKVLPQAYLVNWNLGAVTQGVYFYTIRYTAAGQGGNTFSSDVTGNITKL